MEERDDQLSIRPLLQHPPEGTPPGGTTQRPRRWVPLAIAAGTLVLFGVGAALFGGDNPTGGGISAAAATTTTTIPPLAVETPPTTAATTTTVPPSLDDLLPGIESGLTAVFRDGRFGTVAHWEARSTVPSFLPLTARPDLASFDASAEWLAYLSYFRTYASLHVGLPATSQPAQFIGVSGAVWHPDDPRRLAWTAQLPTAEAPVLYEGIVDAVTQQLLVTREVVEVFPTEALVAWGEWGFLLERRFLIDAAFEGGMPLNQNPSNSRLVELALVTALDPEGERFATVPAAFRDATDEGVLLLASTVENYETVISSGVAQSLLEVDPVILKPVPSGLFLADPRLDLIDVTTSGPLVPERTHLLTIDGDHLIEVDQGSGTTITIYSLTGRGVQTVSIGRPTDVVGLTSDGQFLVVQDTMGTGDLILVNWQSGLIIPVPLGVGVAVAVDVR